MNIIIFTNMNKDIYYVVGVMSGTSLDGIDLCYIKFEFQKKWKFKIIDFETITYSLDWKTKLYNAILLGKKELKTLDANYSLYLSKKISEFILKNNVKKEAIVCSHGHTVFHQPENGITLQIGNSIEIKNSLDNIIVCDFRVQDVKLGGQGAPLVPIGDKLLFYDYDFCLNLGGFANISFEEDSKRIAFDICPVNIVLNYYSEKLGFEFDEDGKISKQGTINTKLLESAQCDVLFAPDVKEIYAENITATSFDFDGLENQMEGKFRFGHFDGVATIVKRLFEIVKPTNAYFGEKDFQQLQIVKKMVEKLKIKVTIIGCPIFRESNGLAMISHKNQNSCAEGKGDVTE